MLPYSYQGLNTNKYNETRGSVIHEKASRSTKKYRRYHTAKKYRYRTAKKYRYRTTSVATIESKPRLTNCSGKQRPIHTVNGQLHDCVDDGDDVDGGDGDEDGHVDGDVGINEFFIYFATLESKPRLTNGSGKQRPIHSDWATS